jgi:sulfur carrier protein
VIVLNGERCELGEGETVAGILTRMGLDAGMRGIAVAVDGEVVPRGDWASFQPALDARVEVLTAMQGG